MQSKEVIKIINEIERKIPVDEWVVDGIDVWPYIRFKLGSRLSKNDLVLATSNGIGAPLSKIIFSNPDFDINSFGFFQ